MLSLSAARDHIVRLVSAVPAEPAPLSRARGCLLRESIRAPEDMPAFDRSAMDGYALAAAGASESYRVIGEIAAGDAVSLALKPGECARVFTGAAIPPGAERVVPQEWTRREGDLVTVERQGGSSFIRKQGEDAHAGDVLLPSGTLLNSGELALLAQIGAMHPQVARPIRVAHVVTGDELVPPDQVPGPRQIRDSNTTLIRALLEETGVTSVEQSRCGDDLPGIQARVAAILEAGCDLLLMSGGASVGDYDYGARVLEVAGFEIVFTKLNLRPGKPLIFATRGATAAFVLPGNPLSHYVVFQVAVRLAIACLQGIGAAWNPIRLPVVSPPPPQDDPRETFWPIRLHARAGEFGAEPLHWQSSGDLRGLVNAHGLLRIAPGAPPLDEQGRGECILLRAPFHA